MSEFSAAKVGIDALEAQDWDLAVSNLTTALKTTRSPKWLVARSKAYIGKKDFLRALRDAELAYVAAAARGSRDLVIEAQRRRAVAYTRLERYADADACATWQQRLIEGGSITDPALKEPDVDERGFLRATRQGLLDEMKELHKKRSAESSTTSILPQNFPPAWNATCALRLQILGSLGMLPVDDARRKVTVKFAPEVSLDDFAAGEEDIADAKKAEKEDVKKDDVGKEEDGEITAAAVDSVRNVPVQKDVRVDFFQSSTTISASVFVKNVPKDEFKVEYDPNELRLSHIPGHEPWYTIPLWGTIDPAESKHTVTANKIELQLKKDTPTKWGNLRRDPNAAPQKAAAVAAAQQPAAAPKPVAAAGPSYPTSSKTGPKDWDNLDVDDEDERDINAFFKKMYAGATPEQQRAMMKSFTESNGTSLSTDWDDVKGRVVETKPPEGVEAKKWET